MKYELCIFDLDGTLVNTISDLTDAMNDALVRVDPTGGLRL